MGKPFFPLDEELQLLPGLLTPQGHEHLVRLAGWMPFEKAAQLYSDLMQVPVSHCLAQRYSEAAGAAYVALQTEAIDHLADEPHDPQPADRLQVSVDGAMVPLLHGQWAEARTLVIGKVQPKVEEQGEWVVHTRELSYFSRKIPAQEFERLAVVETHRRGVEQARQVAAVMDGAEWEQHFVDYHRPDAVRILDFPHAAEHLSSIGDWLWGEGTPQNQAWLQERLHQLKHEGPKNLLAELRMLSQQHPQAKQVSGPLAYLEKREAHMQYPRFQAEGWPIGSGIVESGNKVVVEARLKGAGMHWAERHVNPMLALRNILCSDRWNTEWPRIEDRLRQQARQKQKERQRRKREWVGAQVYTPPFRVAKPLPPDPPHLSKPNPWRNFRYGKALYRPPDPPKI